MLVLRSCYTEDCYHRKHSTSSRDLQCRTQPAITIETTLIHAFGILAFVLLHVILVIGPLTRLDRRFLPLLYNSRHTWPHPRIPGNR